MLKNIFLRAGHDIIKDPGSISEYGVERDLNIAVRDALIPELERQGFEVLSVPDNLDLVNSIYWVNDKARSIDSGLALSIHHNCCQDEGPEVFYYGGSTASKDIAQKLLKGYTGHLGIGGRVRPDTSSGPGQLGWIRKTTPWSLLFEAGYMDSKRDMDMIIGNFEEIAKAITKGICGVYGIKYKEKEKSVRSRGQIKEEIIRLVNQL